MISGPGFIRGLIVAVPLALLLWLALAVIVRFVWVVARFGWQAF